MPSIKLQSSDGVIFSLDTKAAKLSNTFKSMLESMLGFNEVDEKEPIPLSTIRAEVLEKVLNWMTQYEEDPPDLEDESSYPKTPDNISRWDQELMNVEMKMLFEIVSAANFLNIPLLIDACGNTIANIIKTKPEKLLKEFRNRTPNAAAEFSDSDVNMNIIKLKSSDDQVFKVDAKVITQQSKTIRSMLLDMGITKKKDRGKLIIPLSNIESPVLIKVIEWITYHKNDPPYKKKKDEASKKESEEGDEESDEESDDDIKLLNLGNPFLHYPKKKQQETQSNIIDAISDWDQKFINLEQDMLFEIILAAEYLDIKGLLDLGCKTIAKMIKGCSLEQIREIFNADRHTEHDAELNVNINVAQVNVNNIVAEMNDNNVVVEMNDNNVVAEMNDNNVVAEVNDSNDVAEMNDDHDDAVSSPSDDSTKMNANDEDTEFGENGEMEIYYIGEPGLN